MKWVVFIVFMIPIGLTAQDSIAATLIESKPIKLSHSAGVDAYGIHYRIDGQSIVKESPNSPLRFSALRLGPISKVDLFNPLRISVFYEETNSVVILDNRLAEIAIINFNTLSPFRDVQVVATAGDQNIWLYNSMTQQLELFDVKTRRSQMLTMPLEGSIVALSGDYNFCWALTDQYLYQFNYAGSQILRLVNSGFESIARFKDKLIVKDKSNRLFLMDEKGKIQPVKLPELLIKRFFVTAETLYIYTDEALLEFQLSNTF